MDLADLKRKLQQLRKLDQSFSCFGAESHRYQLEPTASMTMVQQFEREHRVRLPTEYVDFLTKLGNGGAGPCYGLFPLGNFSDVEIGDLASPFPHTVHWNPYPQSESDPAAYQACENEYFEPKWISGALPICHQGCGYYDLLVVAGPEYGNIWTDGRVSDQGIAPASSANNRRLGFLDWYNDWLDSCLAELNAT